MCCNKIAAKLSKSAETDKFYVQIMNPQGRKTTTQHKLCRPALYRSEILAAKIKILAAGKNFLAAKKFSLFQKHKIHGLQIRIIYA